MNTNNAAMYRSIFRTVYRRILDAHAAYEADVDAWYTDGEGAPSNWVTEVDEDGEVHQYNAGGRGYSYPNCIHGSSRWTDYDNICGGCEDGGTPLELAQREARDQFSRFNERMAWLDNAPHGGIPREMRDSILTWAFGAIG